jgi:hypothetical protein
MGVATRLRGRARERRIAQLEHELVLADERISRIHAAETVEELRRATTLLRRPRRFPRAAIPAAAGAVVVAVAIAILLAVGHSPSHSPSRPGPVASPSQAAADDPQGTGTFWIENRNGVSITFPPGWRGVGQDERGLTYAVGRDERVQVRVEVTPDVHTDDPAVLANRARRIARRRPGYHEIRFDRETVNGEDAVRFDYLLREEGTKVRTESIFFIDRVGRGIGLFERVPASGYRLWRDVFQGIRSSLQITPETMDLPYPPPTTHG